VALINLIYKSYIRLLLLSAIGSNGVLAKSDRACSISTGFIGFLFGFVGYIRVGVAFIMPIYLAFDQPF
jgi:hypothetical protein